MEFMAEKLVELMNEKQIQQLDFVGHSMGGYLSAVYALRHPEHVKHVILVCPAGIGRRPAEWKPPESLRSPWTMRGQMFRFATTVWNWGVTPGSMIRAAGPLGPRLVEGYVRRRFKQGHHLSETEVDAFQRYMYSVVAARGSGEFALRHILEPFAFPRDPLEDRLHELRVPVTFIYGDNDWMDPKAAERAMKRLAAAREARGEPKKMAEADLRVIFTPNAGHYNFIDQPGVFLENLLESVGQYLPGPAVSRVKAEAAKMPFAAVPVVLSDAKEIEKELEKNPAAAEAHVVTDL